MYLKLGSTVILYESPKRVLGLLNSIQSCSFESTVVLAKDLTKKREEILSGSAEQLLQLLDEKGFNISPHGEFVVMVYPNSQKE